MTDRLARPRPVGLLRVEEARALLAECKRVDEAKSIRDKAQAIKAYLRQQKAARPAALDAEEIALRAEIRCGELLQEQKDRPGVGFWFRGRHEHLILATRGSPPTPASADRPDSVIEAPAGRHSEKPAAVAELIERMFPTLPKVELFARRARPGWTAWGNEAPGVAASV